MNVIISYMFQNMNSGETKFNYKKVDNTRDKRNSILYDDFKCAHLLGKPTTDISRIKKYLL